VRRGISLSVGFAIAFASQADARPRQVKSRKSIVDPASIAELLRRGELALVESGTNGQPWQVVTFSLMDVTPAEVFRAVSDVNIYPKYLVSVDEAKVISKRNGLVLSEWSLNVPVIGLKGQRAMRSRSPSLIEFKGVSGNFKNHHERWDLLPVDGGKRTLVVMHRSVDLANNGGILLKAMIALEPAIEHGIYIASSFVQIQDLRRYVEKRPRAKAGRHTGPLPKFTQISDRSILNGLRDLMSLGELSLIESNSDGSIKQTAVMTVVNVEKAKVLAVAHAAEKYPEFVPNLVRYDLSRGKDGSLMLDYELDAPMTNIEGSMTMDIGKDGDIRIQAVGGDIKRGKWLWTFESLGPTTTVPIHYSYSDVTETSWFVKKLVEIQPLFEHGVVVAASTVQVRAIKERSEGRR